MKQTQIQKPKPPREEPPTEAPTVSIKIAKLWFREDS